MRLAARTIKTKSQKKQPAARRSYFQHMQSVLADIPDTGEQDVRHYDEGLQRWGALEQKIGELGRKSSFIAGKFGHRVPQRAMMIMGAWQCTLKGLLEQRLADERKLSEAFSLQGDPMVAPQSLDEILLKLEDFPTAEEQRAYLVGDHECASLLMEALDEFQSGVEERYKVLLSEERNELKMSGALDPPFNERELQQLLVELRDNTVSDHLDKSCLLNPLPGPRASEIIEELQLRYAASKLQHILQRSVGSEQQTKSFLQTALATFAAQYEYVDQVLWNVIRRDVALRCKEDADVNYQGLDLDGSDNMNALSRL